MKKLFTFLLTALLALNVGWAATSTLTFTSACGGSGTADDGVVWTVTSDAAESTFDSTRGIHYGTGSKAVSYLTLETSGINGTITEIKVNASGASSTSAKLNVTVGGSAFGNQVSLTSSATEYTFTGNASGQVVVTLSQTSAKKALYCKSITVTYSDGGTTTVATPTFSPEAGTYTSAQNVTISTTTSGATIHYTIDGSTPTTDSPVYSTPIEVNSTTTIKAIAMKSGMNNSAVATATYTINLPTTANTLPAANGLADNTNFTFTGNAVVAYYKSYENHTYIWLRDLNATSGGGLFFDTGTDVTTVGTVLSPNWSATKITYNGWIEYKNAANVAANTQYNTQTVEPFDRTDVTLTDSHMNEYIILRGVTVNGNTATTENGTVYVLYNRFGVSMIDGVKYNMVAIVGKYVTNSTNTIQVYPLSVEPTEQVLTITLDPETATATVGDIISVAVTTDPADAIFEATCDNANVIIDEVEGGFEIYSDTPGTYTVSVYAISDDLENTVTGTYTFTEPVQPSSNVFVKVSDDEDLEAGKRYIIMCEDPVRGMGPITKFGSNYAGSAIEGLTITDNEVDISETDVMVLTLGGSSSGGWTFKNVDGAYIAWTSGNTLTTTTEIDNSSKWIINSDYSIKNFGTTDRILQYNSTYPRFACYTSNQTLAVLYVEKPLEEPAITGTLKAIEAGAASQGDKVEVTDQLIGVKAVAFNGKKLLWAKDQAESNDATEKPAEWIDFMRQVAKLQNGEWDQSNWVLLDFSDMNDVDPTHLEGMVLTGVEGVYENADNYTIKMTSEPVQGTAVTYTPNTYSPANFMEDNLTGLDVDGGTLFFMNPKIEEYACINGIWNGSNAFTAPVQDLANGINHYDVKGVVLVDWKYNQPTLGQTPQIVANGEYTFHAIVMDRTASYVMLGATAQSGAPSADYIICPVDIVDNQSQTAIVENNVDKTVQSVRYYNIMGVESDKPFDGMNVKVIRYTDGSCTAVKLMK
ncbi:MAG: chitobiase/beta-hexosaminidase C-terminal domain-containing protein [Muribaculaceae bacterium]|nr:chitobiase/beta-hexosaminidase C-terminal domain-containing protein [Muribaculaceae bacterium]